MKKPHIETIVLRMEVTHTRTAGNFEETACRGLEALLKDARGVKAVKVWPLYKLGEDARDQNFND